MCGSMEEIFRFKNLFALLIKDQTMVEVKERRSKSFAVHRSV
jgi:hypothetical protein